jgi:hypothetical protein
MDTFDNGVALDPCATGLEMKWRGDVVACKSIPKDNDGSGNYLRKNIFVDAHLTVSAAGVATFTYDGNEISATLTSYSGLRANRALFWARTGGADDNHWVDDFNLQAFPFDASSAEVGQVVSFNTSNNNPALFSAQPSIGTDGTLTFTPAPNACGQATVSVTASDNGGTTCEGRDTSAAQTFVIDIACVNDCPTASPQTVSASAGIPVAITLGGTDIDGDTLAATVASNPLHGSLSVSGGVLNYTANAGYSGPDSFTFTVSDGVCSSAPATVTINVIAGDPPICVARLAPESCSLSIGNDPSKKHILAPTGEAGCIVLDGSGSSDPNGDPLTYNWVIDGTNTLAGAIVPVCLPVGCHTVDLIVSDGTSQCRSSFEICVITPSEAMEEIIALVDDSDLGRTNKRPLIASLKAAAASYDRDGHIHTAANQLNAFKNKVRAQVAKSNPATAAVLTEAVDQLLEAIDCSVALASEE